MKVYILTVVLGDRNSFILFEHRFLWVAFFINITGSGYLLCEQSFTMHVFIKVNFLLIGQAWAGPRVLPGEKERIGV